MNTKINKFLNKIQYNFKDISEFKPENKESSVDFTNFIKDSDAHNFNPRRYNFYIQFMEGLNNPDILKNVLYANTVIKSKKEKENESIRKIVNGLQRLYMIPTTTDNVTQSEYNQKKKEKRKHINENVTAKITNLVNSDNNTSVNNTADTRHTIVSSIINSTFQDPIVKKGGKKGTRPSPIDVSVRKKVTFHKDYVENESVENESAGEFLGQIADDPNNKADSTDSTDKAVSTDKADSTGEDSTNGQADPKNNSIIGLYYQKIVSDITQITYNLNMISKKYKKIDKYLKENDVKTSEKLKKDSDKILNDSSNDLENIKQFVNGDDKDTQSVNISYDNPLISFINATDPIFKQKNTGVLPLDISEENEDEIKPTITGSPATTPKSGTPIAPKSGIPGTPKSVTSGILKVPSKLGSKRGGDYILEDSEYQKLNDLVFDIENDTMRPITKLDISNEDRIVFIGVTFIIRFIALSLIEWSMNTNFISSFKQAFMFYCVIYISIFCFITIIVNIIYNYPLQQLYTDKSLVDIPSMLYYFYIYTNGPMRLVIHLIFILILMLIPFIINMGNNMTDKANFNYETKKYTRNTLSRFTLVIWIITSLIAIRY